MDAFFIMLRNVALFVVMAVPGYVLTKTKVLKDEQTGVLSKLLMVIGIPFLILSNTVDKIELTADLAIVLTVTFIIGSVYTVITALLSGVLTRPLTDEKRRRIARFSTVFANDGFLGIPLAMAVFGSGQVLTVVVVLNVMTNLFMNTLGVYLVTGDKKTISPKKALLNPVLISFLIGIALNLLKVKEFVPESVKFINHFSGIVTPLSMTVIGMKLANVRFRNLFSDAWMYGVSGMRLVLFPALIVAALLAVRRWFPMFDSETITGFFIAFAMPTAGLATAYADEYHGDVKSAVTFTLGTTILSALTIPLLYFALDAVLR